jgi:uncharacterized membrane protein YdjX (TVP38/TMEM64 family)
VYLLFFINGSARSRISRVFVALKFVYELRGFDSEVMTYDEEEGIVPKLKGKIEDKKGDYVILRESEGFSEGDCAQSSSSRSNCRRWWLIWWWAKLVLVLAFVGVLIAVFIKWIGPFIMDKEIIPLINWETSTFSRPVLAIILFATVAIFPSIFLPSTPSMWVAGMTFGYGYGFLLILGGVTIGFSLPYFIGSLFHHKMQMWLERYPKKASIIRLAGEGNCFNQFRAVTFIRISPFPYVVYNYCAVATRVKYIPYLLGSLLGMVPEILVAIYTGILIRTLANASSDERSLAAPQIIFNVVGFCATVSTTVMITVYAKRRLKELQQDDEVLLQ